jgi:hypothetical protein
LVVKKSYGLECLDYNQTYWEESCSPISSHDKTRELDTIFKSNRTGRRYLIQEGPESIANGVEVYLDYLLYHLLENATLCDIEHRNTATETTADLPTRPPTERV